MCMLGMHARAWEFGLLLNGHGVDGHSCELTRHSLALTWLGRALHAAGRVHSVPKQRKLHTHRHWGV